MDPGIITAIASGAVVVIGGLVKLGYSLRDKRRLTIAPPPRIEREVTGRHDLEAVLLGADPESVPVRLDRLERGTAQILRHISQINQAMANTTSIAESLDALSQIEAVRARKSESRDRWFEELRNEILSAIADRDHEAAKVAIKEMQERFLMHPRR